MIISKAALGKRAPAHKSHTGKLSQHCGPGSCRNSQEKVWQSHRTQWKMLGGFVCTEAVLKQFLGALFGELRTMRRTGNPGKEFLGEDQRPTAAKS